MTEKLRYGISSLKALQLLLIPLLILSCDTSSNRNRKTDGSESLRGDFIIALIPEHNVFEQRSKYKPLCSYLSKKLGLNVRLKSLPSYGMICDEFLNERVDAAFFGSFSYVLTHARAGAQIIVKPEYPDGRSSYRGYIFTRKGSNIKSVADLKGKTYAFVHPATTAGYLFELAYFKSQGVQDVESYLGHTFFAGSHDASALAVFEGLADCGGGKDRIFEGLTERNPEFAKQMVILSTSPAVPSNGLAVKKGISKGLKAKLKQLLLNLDDSDEGQQVLSVLGITRFIEANNGDYAPVYEMAETAGIDLNTYVFD